MNQRKAGIHTGTEALRRGINERRGQTMLQGFFNYDNPVWRFIGKLGDLVLLNLLWLVCCIPVFTAGAATTAVYYVTLKLVRDEDDSTIKSFFRSFIQNFKQATAGTLRSTDHRNYRTYLHWVKKYSAIHRRVPRWHPPFNFNNIF